MEIDPTFIAELKHITHSLMVPVRMEDGTWEYQKSSPLIFPFFSQEFYKFRMLEDFEQYGSKTKMKNFWEANQIVLSADGANGYYGKFQKMYNLCKQQVNNVYQKEMDDLLIILQSLPEQDVNTELPLFHAKRTTFDRYIDQAIINFIFNLHKYYYPNILSYQQTMNLKNKIRFKDVIELAATIFEEEMHIAWKHVSILYPLSTLVQKAVEDAKKTNTAKPIEITSSK